MPFRAGTARLYLSIDFSFAESTDPLEECWRAVAASKQICRWLPND